MNWMIARTHVVPLSMICAMVVTFTEMDVLGWTLITQNEKSSSWMVTPAMYERDGDGKLVSASVSFTQLACYIPFSFPRMVYMIATRRMQTICRKSNARSVLRTTFDRLYIAHMRRIITTVVITRVCILWKGTIRLQ